MFCFSLSVQTVPHIVLQLDSPDSSPQAGCGTLHFPFMHKWHYQFMGEVAINNCPQIVLQPTVSGVCHFSSHCSWISEHMWQAEVQFGCNRWQERMAPWQNGKRQTCQGHFLPSHSDLKVSSSLYAF